MTAPQITVPTTAPNALSPQPDFDTTFQAFLNELITAQGQQNTLATWMNTTATTVATNLAESITKAAQAVAAQIAAESARDLAASATGITAWVSGGSYTVGDHVWSLVNFKSFRAITTHSGETTDPLVDTTNWVAAVPDGVAVGSIITAYAAPDSTWLRCDGSVYTSATYPLLAAVFDGVWPYTFGSGTASSPALATTANDVDINPSENLIAVAALASPYVNFYGYDGTTMTKQSDPGTLPTGEGNAIAFSPNGDFCAVAHTTSPYITFYDTSTPTAPAKLANPSTLPGGNGMCVAWSTNSRFCYVGAATTAGTRFTIYDFDLGSPVAVGGADTLLAGQIHACEVSPDGNYLVLGSYSSPYLAFYDLTSLSAPAKMADPAVMPSSPTIGIGHISWSPDSRYVIVNDESASSDALIYDMDSGSPVNVANADGINIRQSAHWYDGSARFVAVGSSGGVQICKVDSGTFTVEQTFSGSDIFNSQLPNAIVAANSGAQIIIGASGLFRITRAFDPATHFIVPDVQEDVTNFAATTSGGATGLPTNIYIKAS